MKHRVRLAIVALGIALGAGGCANGEGDADAGLIPRDDPDAGARTDAGGGGDAGRAADAARPDAAVDAGAAADGGAGDDAGASDAGGGDADVLWDGGGCTDLRVDERSAGRGRSVAAPDGGDPWRDPEMLTAADAAPGHAGTVDGVANVRLSSDDVSEYLVADTFGFTLGSDRTVLGIEVDFLRVAKRADTIADLSVELVRAGTVLTGDARMSPFAWVHGGLGSFAVATYGGPGDTWSRAWTPAEIGEVGFGVALRARYVSTAGNDDAMVDHVVVRVHHASCP
ncbi:MAG TPA: hypothetical protein RMH99_19800 [Sandaracinaceae bacterium LLY-WYZ-13_1]|nr:hypothetical protein [Sandaracinaceae bacterium LLY-WYZ-13_1]